MKLVIVESPGKVKNLSQYLGPSYKVLASYGHIRDLPSKTGSVRPEEDFAITWALIKKSEKALAAIVKEVKKADTLILATDLDREGEAISWHILQYLQEEELLKKDLEIQRISFNAVTKDSVLSALKHPRKIDIHLVQAYLARLSLDYLVGFTLSPVLWRKLPGSRSAGRVQSVALRMIVDREHEVKAFKKEEYWTVHGLFSNGIPFEGKLIHFKDTKLDKMAIANEEQSSQWVKVLESLKYRIEDVTTKRVQRHPGAPFITSSLQQEASSKLGYSPSRTMKIAQQLYEGVDINGQMVGLITYMRTDSTFIVPEIIATMQSYIKKTWGKEYLPPQIRSYKAKSNSQEAHEGIRPTDVTLDPKQLEQILPREQWLLYKMIWARTLASQMASAQFDQTTVVIKSLKEGCAFSASGSILIFPGFLALDEEEKEDKQPPKIALNTEVECISITPEQHFTQPPPRFSEASLIKNLEELGIGRPSTYARILQVLQERDYVELEKKKLIPKELGMVVTAFLCKFFAKYVDYNFTANLEAQLDEVSAGKQTDKEVLHGFWPVFAETIKQSQDLKIIDVLASIEKDIMGEEQHTCPRCSEGMLALRLSKIGPFLSCSRYPECSYSCNLSLDQTALEPKLLGKHPQTGFDVVLKKGPYGWYIEHHETRFGLPPLFSHEAVSLEQALWLLSLPKVLGKSPETGEDITFSIGRFGPYVKQGKRFFSVKDKDLQTLTLEDAMAIIQKPPAKKREKKVG